MYDGGNFFGEKKIILIEQGLRAEILFSFFSLLSFLVIKIIN